MSVVFALLILNFIGPLAAAREPDIDINRIKLISKEESSPLSPYNRRRSIDYYKKRNDYDYYSNRVTELRTPVHLFYDASSTAEAQKGKVHQPREDPRFFYQSDAYIKENNGKNLNNEVSSIHLGRGVVNAGTENYKPLPIRLREELNYIHEDVCIRCPYDRTLIAKAGLDRALLLYPRLTTCSGIKAPRDTHFVHMYGPKFDSLLKEGSHTVVGRIIHKNDILQTCKMQIHVLLQTCSVPKYLVPHCDEKNKTCSFRCRNPKAGIRGHKTLTCGEDMKWTGRLPTCTVHSWCTAPPPPEHGKMVCQGNTLVNGQGFGEGARCRVRCEQNWRKGPRAISICRRGLWTHELKCHPKHNPYNNNIDQTH